MFIFNKNTGLVPLLKQSSEANRKKSVICLASRNNKQETKQEVVSITYEEIGLFPRSFSRVLDRFLKQVFSDVENLVIQEYRFYRYLFLTTLKCLLILFFIPFFVNFIAKTYIVGPLTEYFWNTKQTEIFLNSYQQKRAFAELKEFEEKTYFESLIFPKSVFVSNISAQYNFNEINDLNNFKSVNTSSVANSENMVKKPIDFYPPLATHVPLTPKGAHRGGSEGDAKLQVFQNSLDSELAGSYPLITVEQTKDSNLIVSLPSLATHRERQMSPYVSYQVTDNQLNNVNNDLNRDSLNATQNLPSYLTESNMKSSLFVYQTQEADKNIQQRYQEKTIEIAQRYNDQSMEAITNIFADLISLLTLFYLLYALEIQINITKSFLLEVFFGLDDSKKSLLILLVTDLLVGYHSSNLWELFFEFLFHHYGLPESQTGIFLLVATLPVLLDVLFKYLIFRHLNRSSPATVATYHAMIE